MKSSESSEDDGIDQEEVLTSEELMLYAARCGDVETVQDLVGGRHSSEVRPFPLPVHKQERIITSSSEETYPRSQILKPLQYIRDDNGNTALHLAAANGHVSMMKLLLDFSPSLASCQNERGNTPLHWAVKNSKVEAVKLLVTTKSMVELSASETSSREEDRNKYSVDVLLKNQFNRSAINEAFNLIPPDITILQLLLEHPSAKPLEHPLQPRDYEPSINVLLTSPSPGSSLPPSSTGINDDDEEKHSSTLASSVLPKQTTDNDLPEKGVQNGRDDTCIGGGGHIVGEVVHAIKFWSDQAPGSGTKREDNDVLIGQANNHHSNNTSWFRDSDQEDGRDIAQFVLVREIALEEKVIRNCSSPPLNTMDQTRIISDDDGIYLKGDKKLDITGVHLWSAGVVASRWIAQMAREGLFSSKAIIELGAGCGTPGLTCLLAPQPPIATTAITNGITTPKAETKTRVMLTDLPTPTLDNLMANVLLNASFGFPAAHPPRPDQPAEKPIPDQWIPCGNGCVAVRKLDWTDPQTWPRWDDHEGSCEVKHPSPIMKFDVVIGSDLIYEQSMVEPLISVVTGLLTKPHGRFYYTYRLKRQGADLFVQRLREAGLKCEEVAAPACLRNNPLADQTQEVADQFFNELQHDDFLLLKGGWR